MSEYLGSEWFDYLCHKDISQLLTYPNVFEVKRYHDHDKELVKKSIFALRLYKAAFVAIRLIPSVFHGFRN